MEERYSTGVRVLLYILSFLVVIAGVVIGVVFLTRDDEESKHVGKICLICAVAGIVAQCLCWFLWLAAVLGLAGASVKPPGVLPPPGG